MPRTLKFGDVEVNPDVRRLSDMVEVVYDKDWLNTISNKEDIILYYMYRDLALDDADRKVMRKEHLRYDITIIPPRKLGCEYVKTAGHLHPNVPGTNLSYTEIYEVLEGRAHYLLQKSEAGYVEDVVLVEAEKGDKVIIPPNYAHVTINPTQTELKMANWVSDRFSSIYEPIKERRGASYFELVDDSFIRNENYDDIPPLRRIKPSYIPNTEINKIEPMYSLIKKNPSALRFLNEPQNYRTLFKEIP